jgi:hypothetical protein
MPTKPLDRLMFTQGGMCFFCKEPIPQGEASVEHLVASANGGPNGDDNCVVCCKALNALFGSMSLKEKVQLVLNQKGQFRCPNKPPVRKTAVADAVVRPSFPHAVKGQSEKIALIIADLHRRGSAKPSTVKALSGTNQLAVSEAVTSRGNRFPDRPIAERRCDYIGWHEGVV